MFQVVAQPARDRNREALLVAAIHDCIGHDPAGRTPQEHLRRQIPDFQRRGQAKGELHGSVIEKRASILEAVRRRRAIVHQDQ